MKKFSLTTLLAGAVLFVTMGTSSLNAQMKCGAGKCGTAMEKPACCKTPETKVQKKLCCTSVGEGKPCTCELKVECSCEDKNNCTCLAQNKAPVLELKKPACCESTAVGKACACPPEVKCSCKDKSNCTCPTKKAPAMKCGTGKCGGAMSKPAKQAPKEAMKCGTGKCG